MKSPLDGGFEWLELDEVDSTQKVAAEALRDSKVAAVLTHKQTAGVGRFGRPWITGTDDSLTMSLIFRQYANHAKPHLIGMSVAIAVAGATHANLQWPNDIVVNGRKLGGILTELKPDPDGRLVAIVGVGVNLNQTSFPEEIAARAVSLRQARGEFHEPMVLAAAILDRLKGLPEPADWLDLAPIWNLFDRTPGKHYVLPSGEEATAIGVGSDAQLLCTVAGESQTVLAADAIFGAAL